jgi:hypothetical protein
MEGQTFQNIPMLHEHQMFIGLAGLVMVIWGALRSRRHHAPEIARLLWVPLVGIMLVTLNSDGVSLWRIFSDLPLSSAIRAMTRIDLVLLFFAAGLIAVLVQQALEKGMIAHAALAVGGVLLAVEATQVRTSTTSVATIRQAVELDVTSARQGLSDDSIIFIAQSHNADVVGEQPWFAMEIRAMWVGSVLGLPVINGYSGKVPENYSLTFGETCSEAGRRLASAYRLWPELVSREGSLGDMLGRVHLVGFHASCDLEAIAHAARSIPRNDPLPRVAAAQISLRMAAQETDALIIEILNSGSSDLVPESLGPDDVNLAFRWQGAKKEGGDGYTRVPILGTVPAGGSLQMRLPITVEDRMQNKILEISLVQEGQFWFHDVGMARLEVKGP